MEELTLKFTVNQVNLILDALSQMPFKAVMEIIPSIQQQAKEQLPAKEE